MGTMTPVFQKAQDNPINPKIVKEMRIATVYICWALKQPVIVGSLGKRIWDTEPRGLLCFLIVLSYSSKEVGPGSIPEPHNSPEDSSPSALPEPQVSCGEGSGIP